LVHYKGLPVPPRGEGLTKSDTKDGKGRPRDGGKGGGKGDKNPRGGAGGGGSDSLEFKNDYTDNASGHQGQSPVAVVLLHDDYSPPLGYYYFRQKAFSQYNGHRLVETTRDDVDHDILVSFPTERTTVL